MYEMLAYIFTITLLHTGSFAGNKRQYHAITFENWSKIRGNTSSWWVVINIGFKCLLVALNMLNSPDLRKLNTKSVHTLKMWKQWICSLTSVFIKPSWRPLYYRKQYPEEVLLIWVCVTQSTLKATLLALFLPRSLHFPLSKRRQYPQTSESVFKQQSAVWLCSRPREREAPLPSFDAPRNRLINY